MNVQALVPDEMIRDLLVTAMEGGSGYWIDRADRTILSPEQEQKSKELDEIDGFENGFFYNCIFVGGAILFRWGEEEDDPKEGTLTIENARSAIEVLAQKYPHHFADIIKGNMDAGTADAWLQCALMGELIYG